MLRSFFVGLVAAIIAFASPADAAVKKAPKSLHVAQLSLTGAGGSPKAAGGGGGGATFVGTDVKSVNPTFGAGRITMAIGTPSADRIVFMGIVSNGTSNGTPVVNDLGTPITMNRCAGASDTTVNVGLWYANVTVGTTATFSFGGGASSVTMVAGVLKGQSGGGGATSSSPQTYTAGGAESAITVTPTVPAGGFGIVATGFSFPPAGTPVYTWGGTVTAGGDETSLSTDTGTLGLAHSSATGAITISTTGIAGSGLGSGGTMAACAMAP